jgi:hypothetical protein
VSNKQVEAEYKATAGAILSSGAHTNPKIRITD